MYLSRIALNMERYETMGALQQTERLHAMIAACFSLNEKKLWRIDSLKGKSWLLVLSETPPISDTISEQIGFIGETWETKDYTPLMERIKENSAWHFRLTANPTQSIPVQGERGKVKAISVVPKQREWLQRQGEKHGFNVQQDQFDVVANEWKHFKHRQEEITLLSTTFEGYLTVTDPRLFGEVLIQGIGRGKAYGLGLMTVVSYG